MSARPVAGAVRPVALPSPLPVPPFVPLLVPLLVLLSALLAGCSGTEPPADGVPGAGEGQPGTAPDGAQAQGLGPSLEPLAFADCVQFHTAYPAQASDLQPLMPDGFVVALDEAGLAQVQAIATSCASGGDGPASAHLWVRVPAVPPAEWADAEASHAVALEAYAGGQALQWLHGAGIHLVEACSCRAATDPGLSPLVLHDAFVSDAEEDDYELDAALSVDDSPFGPYRTYTYAAQDGKAVARVLETGDTAVGRGLGAAALRYTGPGAAPSAFPGTAHVIEGLAMRLSSHPLEAA